MTDKELEAIKERWNWILTEALPDASQARADVRALWVEVRQLREIARAVAETEPTCESGYGDVDCAYCDGDMYQRDATGKIIGRSDPAYDPKFVFGHTDKCPVTKARALLGEGGE